MKTEYVLVPANGAFAKSYNPDAVYETLLFSLLTTKQNKTQIKQDNRSAIKGKERQTIIYRYLRE